MEMRQIRYFLAVEETGTFTKAADRVYVSQPALSAGIRALEDQLGVALFVRGKRRATLTPEGRQFSKRAHRIVDEFSDAKHELRGELKRSDLKIGVYEVFSIDNLVALIKAFKAAHPRFGAIRLIGGTTTEVARMLGRGNVDIVLTALATDEKNTHSLPLYEEDYMVVVPHDHPLAERKSIQIADLHRVDFVQREHCESFRQAFQAFQERGCEPNVICHTDQDSWTIRLVQAGLGVTVIPRYRQIDGTVQLSISDLNLSRSIGLRWSADRLDGPAGVFRDFAQTYDWVDLPG